ncbi:MAG: polysaccharide biosynthesis protein [Clostridia bacterium]|nr:polysaccharide biosynthesis protein [Clostridia bacterium]
MEKNSQKQNMLNGAMILLIATALVKIIGALYKMPLTILIGEVGRGYFASAYQIYTPIYAISMAGLPIAVSKLVSQYIATNRFKDAQMVKKVATRLFIITGLVGTSVLLLVSYPYSIYVCKNVGAVYSILMIAPAIFFCCMMSIYRGFYEGTSNMKPTAVSEVVEAIGKLILGLVFSYLILKYGLSRYEAGLTVFGKTVADKSEALSAIYPFAAAGAILGVTIGTVLGFIYLKTRYKIRGDGFTRTQLVNSLEPYSRKDVTKSLIKLAIPMVISSLVLNISNLIDATLIQYCLNKAIDKDYNTIYNMYKASLEASQTLRKDTATYLYGCYFASQDFKNLIPTITLSLGISAIPALSAAYAEKDKGKVRTTIESAMRIVSLIAMPAGFGMAVLAEPILTLVYGGTNSQNLIPIAAPIMSACGYATIFFSLSSPVTNMLQAIGRADVPVKALIGGSLIKVVANIVFVSNPKYNIKGAVIGTIVCYTLICVVEVIALLKLSKTKINYVSVFIKPLGCSALCAIVAFTSYKFLSRIFPVGDISSHFNGMTIASCIAIVLAVIVYFLGLLFSRALSKDDIIMLPKGEKIAKVLEKYKLLG